MSPGTSATILVHPSGFWGHNLNGDLAKSVWTDGGLHHEKLPGLLKMMFSFPIGSSINLICCSIEKMLFYQVILFWNIIVIPSNSH
jgi:hypothetical protein